MWGTPKFRVGVTDNEINWFQHSGYTNEYFSQYFTFFLTDLSHEDYRCSLNCAEFSQGDLADLGITALAEFMGRFL